MVEKQVTQPSLKVRLAEPQTLDPKPYMSHMSGPRGIFLRAWSLSNIRKNREARVVRPELALTFRERMSTFLLANGLASKRGYRQWKGRFSATVDFELIKSF